MPASIDNEFLAQTRIPLGLTLEAVQGAGNLKAYDLGPLLQGALMERIDTDYAAALHSC